MIVHIASRNSWLLILCISTSIREVISCNSTSFGSSACIHISRYSGKQWSTCVTDVYIRQKSKGRHGCARGQVICVYQCMLEIHDANSGKVSSPCKCLSNVLTTDSEAVQTVSPNIILPSWCFSPTGGDCSWFKTCLGKRYSCGAKFKEGILKFSEEICGLYLNPYLALSKRGNTWINGVRKCLQVALVPLLRKWNGASGKTCGLLTKQAISSYSHCFYSPYPATVPTICELSLTDLWKIFWHLRQTLASAKVQYSLLSLLRTIENCTGFRKVTLPRGNVRKLVLQVKLEKSKKFVASQQTFPRHNLGKRIAEHLRLDKEGITWFAYSKVEKTLPKNTIELVFYIADKHEHRMSRKLSPGPLINLNNTVITFLEAVRRKELCFQEYGSKVDYCVTATKVCQDLECLGNTCNVQAARNVSPVLRPVNCFLHFGLILYSYSFLHYKG